ESIATNSASVVLSAPRELTGEPYDLPITRAPMRPESAKSAKRSATVARPILCKEFTSGTRASGQIGGSWTQGGSVRLAHDTSCCPYPDGDPCGEPQNVIERRS